VGMNQLFGLHGNWNSGMVCSPKRGTVLQS